MEGHPLPTVVWKKDDDIAKDKRITIETHGNASLFESSITITNLRNTDAGAYVCSATNDASKQNVPSKPGQLVVNCK
jgi:hypothetical protein